jgi:tryptophanyl-tRNA synthetase
MKRVFSGIQPSGVLHIGNYIGAIKQFVQMQNEADDAIFCVVDLHAITVPQDPKELKKNILSVAAMYIACGIDPNKSTIFVQSDRPEHSELAIILNCYTSLGELQRMTQFKEKAENKPNVSAGLFDYPVLMAADILLYRTTEVPIGDDQKQHLEITRNIADRINNKYPSSAEASGELFAMPNPIIKKSGARIMGLDDPTKKMSKSASSALNYIALTDDAETVRNKIKRAVTDSGSEIKSGKDKPAISNLLTIYSEISGKTVAQLEKEFEGKGYGEFKDGLAEEIVKFLAPIQEKYNALMAEPEKIRQILSDGANKIEPIAQKTLKDIKSKIGLG